MAFSRGFKSEAEAIAEQVRLDLDLGNLKRLDPRVLAEDLKIPIVSLSQLVGLCDDDPAVMAAVNMLHGPEQSTLSATTVFRGSQRLIVFNDRNPAIRQASDLAHELAHGLLLHEPAPALDAGGCRIWDASIEEEAAYLGGCLLIPGKGARYHGRSGKSDVQVAAHYECSEEMATWRINVSGARKLQTARR